MRRLPLALALIVLALPVRAQPAVERPLDRALSAAVRPDGRVDYGALAADRSALDAALAAIAAQDPAALRSDAQKTAFLVNAYNAHVLDRVLAHRARHLEREGLFAEFFETPVRVAGVSVTLNQVEHGALRQQGRVDGRAVPATLRALRPRRLDPRVHAALNCAAVSCPPLRARAYRAATLDRDLGRQYAAFLDSDRAVRVEDGAVVLSSVFDWFAPDFEARGPLGDVLLADMAPRRAAALRPRLAGRSAADFRRARAFAYDWTVNRSR